MTSPRLTGRPHATIATPLRRAAAQPLTGDTLFGVGIAGLLAWAALCGRGVWFFIDEWVVITRYHGGGWLHPFNGHLSIVPIAIYRGLLTTVGYHFVWYRIVGLLCYGAAPCAVFWFARQRVHPVVAALAALAVAWSSQARLVIMFPLLLNFSLPMAAVIVTWILLDRTSIAADVAASAATALALATSAVGLLAPISVATYLLVHRKHLLRRVMTFMPPVALWTVWYLFYGLGKTGAGGSISTTAAFAGRELLAAFAGLAGGWTAGGVVLFVGTVGLLFLAIARWKTFDGTALTILATLVGFLVLTAVGRNDAGAKFHLPPIAADSDRYVWVDALLVICLIVHCLHGRRLPAVATLMAGALTLANAAILTDRLYHYREVPIDTARGYRTVLVAIDALGARADPSRNLPLGFLPVSTPDYLGLARHFRSPVAHVKIQELGSEQIRGEADRWMVHDLGIGLSAPVSGGLGCTPRVDRLAGIAAEPPVTFVIHAGAQPTMVSLRRLAQGYDASPPIGELAAGSTGALRIPRDHSTSPWYLRVVGPGAKVSRCH